MNIYGPSSDDSFLIQPNKDGNIVLSKAAVDAIRESLKNDVKCSHCGGRCCSNYINVYESDEVFNDEKLTTIHNSQKVMKAIHGNCIALKKGQCTIYNKRPSVCRLFELGSDCCKEFFFRKKLSHSCKNCNITKKGKNLTD